MKETDSVHRIIFELRPGRESADCLWKAEEGKREDESGGDERESFCKVLGETRKDGGKKIEGGKKEEGDVAASLDRQNGDE